MEPFITIVTKVDQEQINDTITVTALTGFLDVSQTIPLPDGRAILLEKILPFSILGALIDEEGC